MRSLILITLFSAFFTSTVFSQQVGTRHPRVLEIERMLQSDVQTVVRDLIPGESFHAKVRVEPLHRNGPQAKGKEALPYYEASDEIRDEWDDPNKTEFELLGRVTRLSVKLVVPLKITTNQISELKTAIQNKIPFIEGRDLVEIEQKEWPVPEDHTKYTSWILGIGAALLVLLGIINILSSTWAAGRLARAIAHIRINTGDSGSVSSNQPLPSVAGTSLESSVGGASGMAGGGHIQMNDTLRMSESVMGLIKRIENAGSFPTLEDMITFEQYLQSYPKSAGALLADFPHELKNKIFEYSFSEVWLKAITEGGEVDNVSFELMNKIMKINHAKSHREWETLLIMCWRLQQQLPQFLKKIESDDALVILQHLPQSLSIWAAREVMPGQWAAVFKKTHGPEKISVPAMQKYTQMATEMKALRSPILLAQYKRDMDLVHYLRQCDFQMEKEIYHAIPKESSLPTLRPPFYSVLEAGEENLKSFVPTVSLEEWALALLNVPRTDRLTVEVGLSDKQKFRFIELLKRYDRMGASNEVVGRAREQISRAYHDFQARNHKTTKITDAKKSRLIGEAA